MSSKVAPHPPEETHRKLRITAADYQRMGAAGIFDDKPRVELIDGEIYTMSPFTPDHNGHVDKISRFFNKALFDKILVRTQGSVQLDDHSEPEPDIAILRFREDFYSERQAGPADILLLIEVAVNSLETDRTTKKRKYAGAGIPEYWIVIPPEGIVEVYRQPEDGVYREKRTYRKEEEWRWEALDLVVQGGDLLI